MAIPGKRYIVFFGYLLALFIIVSALLQSIGELTVPLLRKYKEEIASLVAVMVAKEVVIQDVDITWHFFEPFILLKKVKIIDPSTHRILFIIPKIALNLNFFKSIKYKKLMLETLVIDGVHLTMQVSKNQFAVIGLINESNNRVEHDAALNWFFLQPHVTFKNLKLKLIFNEQKNKIFFVKKIQITNRKNKHIILGKMLLDNPLATLFHFKFTIDGDITHLIDSNIKGFLYAEGISLPSFLKDSAWHKLTIKEALGSAKIWFVWQDHALQKIQTIYQFFNIDIYSAITKQHFFLNRLSGEFGWLKKDQVYELSGENILIDLPKYLWPASSFSLHYQIKNKIIHFKDIQFSYAHIEDITQALAIFDLLPSAYKTVLNKIAPKGNVHNAKIFFLADDNSKLKATNFEVVFSHLFLQDPAGKYAIGNMSGKFLWQKKEGKLELNSENSSITISPLFIAPWYFNKINGHVDFAKEKENKWQIKISNLTVNNNALRANVSLEATVFSNRLPHVDLNAYFSLNNAKEINHYLPLKIFNKKLQDWLLQAFDHGSIKNGRAILQGDVSAFPFDKQKGNFFITGKVAKVDLHFAPDWPLLKNMYGELTFHNREMNFVGNSAQFFAMPLQTIKASIPDIGLAVQPILTLQSNIATNLQKVQNFIKYSPMKAIIPPSFASFKADGLVNANIKLIIPLLMPIKTHVMGFLFLKDAEFSLFDGKFVLTNLLGNITFSERKIIANALQGKLFGSNITATLTSTNLQAKAANIIAQVAGTFTPAKLGELTHLPLQKWISGSTAYTAKINFPLKENILFTTALYSNLQGLKLDILHVQKKTAAKINFNLYLRSIAKYPLQVKFLYGQDLSGSLLFSSLLNTNFSLVGGELKLGGGDIAYPVTEGFKISGFMKHFSLPDLARYKKEFASTTKTDNDLLKKIAINNINIQLGEFDLGSFVLKNLHIDAALYQNHWLVNLANKDLNGQINWPLKKELKENVTITFNKLTIPALLSTRPITLHPKDLRPFVLIANDVRYGSLPIGHVELKTSLAIDTLLIKHFLVNSPNVHLLAKGKWENAAIYLQGLINIKNINQFLNDIHMPAKNLVATTAQMKFNADWQNRLIPSLPALNAEVLLTTGQGRIVNLGDSTDAKIGLGRLLNLLNIQSIPRRLSLDFSDLFENGYSFDTLQGHFNLKKGVAITNDLVFDGPIALVAINGQIGFINKEVNIKLSITPYVTSSLPIVATIAVNPLAGAATWLVDKIVSHQVSKMTTYQYRIQGPWSEPKWQEIGP